jgi:hypothetical protein
MALMGILCVKYGCHIASQYEIKVILLRLPRGSGIAHFAIRQHGFAVRLTAVMLTPALNRHIYSCLFVMNPRRA